MKVAQQLAARPVRYGIGLIQASKQTRANVLPANHVMLARRDRLEQQAVKMSQRILRGEKMVRMGLGHAAAASVRLEHSPGHRLPPTILREAEEGFDADLSLVRIHADADARRIAQDSGAKAFTSGADIYFAEGRYDPSSVEGQRLLFHEIAHVLQQTAQASSGTRVRAARAEGAGPAQADDSDDKPTFVNLRTAHAPNAAEFTSQYNRIATSIATALVGADPAASIDSFAAKSLGQVASWPESAESLLYDVLKLQGKYARAAELLARDDFSGALRIQTAFESTEALDAVDKRPKGSDSYRRVAEQDGVLKAYIEEYLRLIEVFVLQPIDQPIPSLFRQGTTEKIREHYDRQQKDLADHKKLTPNELVINALSTIVSLDDLRVAACQKIRERGIKFIKDSNLPDIYRKRKHAEDVQLFGTKVLPDLPIGTEDASGKFQVDAQKTAGWKPFLKRLGARVESIGKNIVELWDRAEALNQTDARIAKQGESADPPQIEPPKEFEQVKALSARGKLPDRLKKTLEDLNKADTLGKRPPDSAEFAARVTKLADGLEEFSRTQLEKGEPALFHRKKTEEEVATIWLTVWLYRVAAMLRSGAATGKDGAVRVKDPNYLIALRIGVALMLNQKAHKFDWKGVADAAAVILEARLETHSQLALLPGPKGMVFEKDDVEVEQMTKDMVTGSALKELAPFTSEAIALFYRAEYYRKLNRQLIAKLPTTTDEEKKLVAAATAKDAFIASHVARVLNEQLPMPHRFSTRGAIFYAPKEGDTDFRKVFNRWLQPTPFLQDNTAKGEIGLIPLNFKTPLWVWFVPGLVKLVPSLKKIPTLRTMVATVQGPGADQDKLSEQDWLDKLMGALGPKFFPAEGKAGATDEEKKAILDAVRSELLMERDKAWSALVPNLQKASRIDREILAPRISKMLEGYDQDHITNYTNPGKALGYIVAYDTSIVPDTEEAAQLTSLMLEIAQALASAFEYETRFDIIDGYLGWLEIALNTAPKLKAMTDDGRSLYLPPQENTAQWVQDQTDKLQALADYFNSVRAAVQRETGFTANAAQNSVTDIHFGYPVNLGATVYSYSGTPYTLTQVLKSFRYHPSYGTKTGSEKGKGKRKLSAYAEPLFLDPSGEKPLDLQPGEKLLKVKVGKSGVEREIGASDTGILDDLSFGTNQFGFSKSMENLAAAIETYMEILLDVVELIPGVGQAVTGARLVASILEFLASGDYKSAIDLLSGEIQKTLEGLLDRIKTYLDPENLILLLLFGDERLEALLAHTSLGEAAGGEKREEPQKGGAFAFLKKVIVAFRKLGHALGVGLRQLHDKVEWPMGDFRSFTSTRPALAFAIGFAAKYIFELVSWTQQAFLLLGADKNDPDRTLDDQVADLKKKINAQQEGIGERVQHILKKVEELQLPETILDMAPVVAKLVDKILDIVLRRLGVKGKVINIIAQHTGLRGLVSGKVGQSIVDAGLDPNVYWREQIVPQIADKFNAARDALVGELNNVLSSKPLSGLFTTVDKAAPVTLQPEGDPYEETKADLSEEPQAFPSPDRPLRMRPGLLPLAGPGTPLNRALRARFEARFGEDFGHVRLHTGGEAESMTGAFGADALTTGSHVFLRPGISPEFGRGRRILGHELVHVVQQTGARSPGAGARSPKTGRPELGLKFDRANEQMADNLSAAAERGAIASLPLGEESKAIGLQPAGVNLSILASMLKKLTDVKAVEQSALAMEKEAKKEKLPAKVNTSVDNTLAFFKQLTKDKMARPPAVFSDSDIKDSIVNQLTHRDFLPKLEKVLPTAAKESMEDLPQPKTARGTKPAKPSENERVLIPGHFARKLEGYVLARTGIAVAITMNKTEVIAPNGKKVETVEENNPIKEIRAFHVHLPVIDSNSRLWAKALDNTWKSSVGDEKQRAKLRSILRPLLGGRGVVFGIWAWGSTYRFSYLLELEVNALMKASKAGPLEPDALPPWTDYVKAEKPGDTIGLRLATYGDPSQSGTGRESHHLTQFLLADYFSNTNAVKPFATNRKYPGVTMSGGVVTQITSSRGDIIEVAGTIGKNRGEAMPAISLAAATHRGGDLHITPEPDDVGGEIKKKQGYAVNNEFVDRQMPALAMKPAEFAQYQKKKGDAAVQDEIWTAAQKTYAWVESRMNKQLAKNMVDLEFDYYLALDEAKTTPMLKNQPAEQTRFKTELQAVPKNAYAHNKKVMEGLRWKLGV